MHRTPTNYSHDRWARADAERDHAIPGSWWFAGAAVFVLLMAAMVIFPWGLSGAA
jgi:hypothetical protein